MMIRVIGLLAVLGTLATGCAFEQQDEAVTNAPGTPAANTGGGGHPPSTGQGDPGVKVGGSGSHHVLPSTAFEPCDPEPQPWRPNNCPNGPNGGATSRGLERLTPTE